MDGLKTLNLGKAGITEPFVAEVKVFLRKHRRIRIRVLKSALVGKRTSQLAAELASKASAVLADVRGHTITLALR